MNSPQPDDTGRTTEESARTDQTRLEDVWMLLMDPGWRQEHENQPPPIESVVGLWPVMPDQTIGKFRSNPDYRPSDENSPTDPLDAVLRQVLRGPGTVEQIQAVLHDVLIDIALNGDGRPLIVRSPDDIPCVVVVSSEPHRTRMFSPDWDRIDLKALIEYLPEDVDVLFNPGAIASIRLTGDFMRTTAALSDDEVVERYGEVKNLDDIRLSRWVVSPPDADAPTDPESGDAAAMQPPAASETSAPAVGRHAQL